MDERNRESNFGSKRSQEGGGKKLRAAAFVTSYEGSPPFICSQCPARYRDGRGCTKPTKTPIRLDPEIDEDGKLSHKYVFEFCPVNYIHQETKTLLSLYQMWRQGKMLNSGGVGEQPAKYIDIMQFMDGQWAQIEREAIDKMNK